MDLDGVTYQGPPIDDLPTLARLSRDHAALLRQIDGFVAFAGGLHVRGACRNPRWHALAEVWDGPSALHRHYHGVRAGDVPFAQDALGDQFLLRDGLVMRLFGETGGMEALELDLVGFLEQACLAPRDVLSLAPLEQFWADGGRLHPGELLSAYPPFCTVEAANGVSLHAMPALERLDALAHMARAFEGVPDGGRVRMATDGE